MGMVLNRKEVTASFWKELQMKESLLQQKSRAKWVKEGDMNSKYFHSLLKYCRRICNVVLLNENGEWIEEVEEIKFGIKKHFEDNFVESCHNLPNLDGLTFNKISALDVDLLLEPFTEEEIKEEVWLCDGDKSPGLDGFNLRIIKQFWDLMKNEVLAFFNEFYGKASIPKVIPKHNNPQGLGDFRPICLTDCLCKILAKVLASRIRRVLPGIISKCQSAFLGG